MDVRLPNGNVVTDIPEGTTQYELAELAIANNIASKADFPDLFFSDIAPVGEVPEDDTTFLGGLGEFGKRGLGGTVTGLSRIGTGLAELIPGVDDDSAREVQRDIDQFVADKLAYDPAYDDTYAAQLGTVVGEMVPMVGSFFLPGGLPARAVQLATMIGPSVSEGGMDRAEYEARTGEELSTFERLASKGTDIALGRLEQFGFPSRVLKGLPKGHFLTPEGSKHLNRMEDVLRQGVREGAQEAMQSIARDMTTLAIYDEDRKIGESAVEDFQLGGGAGAIFELVLGSVASRGPKAKAPSEMQELTEEEIGQEQERREEESRKEAARRREMDDVVSAGTGERFTGPTMPDEVRKDPLDTSQLDPNRDLESIANDVIRVSGSRLPVDAQFNVKTEGRKSFVEQDGEQFGPAFDDPLSAQELANRLTGTSQQLRKTAEIDYIVDNAGLEYDNIQADEAKRLGRAVLSDSERVISVADANLATGRDIGSAINRSRAKQKENEILKNEKRKATTDEITSVQSDFVSLKEIRAANKGDIGRLGDVIAEKDADFLAFRDDPRPTESPTSPTRPRQPALGRRQQALKTFSSSFENAISSERAFKELLARKRMDVDVNSNEFRGLIKKTLGKTPPKKDPLANLSPNDRRYLYHRIRRLPSFESQATKIPDFSVKTPDAETVRRARRQVEVDADPADVIAQRATSRAEARRVEDEARRTAGPRIDRAEQGVEQGMEVAEYDIETSGLAQQLKDMLNKFGVSDEVSVRLVEKLGTARRDSDGNIYILGRDPRDMDADAQEYGVFTAGARVIQVGLEGVRDRVKDGATYEEAVARAMNHEIVHALRRMDLFTREEYSLLERLSRKYEKPGDGMTYGQWATKNYEGLDAIRQQEEAIAEMISDALTDGVVIDNKVTKPTGKPAAIFKKIVDFFKDLVGIAERADTDIDSFKALVDEIQGGRVGRRERGVVRTALERDYEARQDTERGITTADLATRTGDRKPYVLRDVVREERRETPEEKKGQRMEDAPEVDDEMFSRRVKRAAEQDAEDAIQKAEDKSFKGKGREADEAGVDAPSPSKRKIDPAKVEKAVADNLEAIKDNPQSVPRFSVKASPEAQYIARNPDAGLKPPPDEEMFSKKKDSAAVDKLTKGPDREAPNFKVFMDATDIGDIGTFFTRLKKGAINRYAPLEKYYQKIPGLRELEADSSAMAAALFADKSKAILASAIKYGVPVYRDGLTKVEDFTHTSKKYKRLNGTYRGLIGVMSLIHNKEDGDLRKLAQAYAMVQRGNYLDKRGQLSPVDPKTRREILAEVDALTQSDGYNPIKGWHEVWMAYNDKTIDFLRDTGILNDETADVWRDSSYIPFYRTGEKDNLPRNAKNVFGDLSRMAEFVAYRGSEKAVDVGLVESVTTNLNAAIDMGMKNVAQQRIVRDMQNLGLARQVPKDTPEKDGNYVTFKINGNKVKFEIDDNLIHDSLLSSAGIGFPMAEKYLGMPASFLREMVTRDPGFMFANMMRDTLSTWATSGADFTPFKDTFGRFNDDLERLEKLGVVGGYDFAIDRADIGKFYENETRKRGISGDPINMFVNLWNVAGDFTTKSDAATRQAVYDDVLARTGNEAEAAFQAMEIINFSRRGSNPYVKLITATIPFLNARFQGLDVFMRSLGGDYSAVREEQKSKIQLRLAVRASTMIGVTALYYALASGNDWYEEQDEEVRELNWLIPTPWGVPFKLPIPFEVGLLFKTLPEAMLANFAGRQSDRETRETIQRGIESTLEINPLGFQIIAPFAEAALNRSAFTGRPVVPIYMSQITPGLQTTMNTPEFIADVGELLNISPMKIDHVVRGYTGTLGSYAVGLADVLYRSTIDGALGDDIGFAGERPSKNMFEFPLWRRFFGRKEGGGLRADVYDMYYDIQEVVRTMNELEDSGRLNELRAFIAGRSHVLALKDDVYYLRNRMTKARQEKEQILAADIDPKKKQKLMEQIDATINDELKAVVPELKRLRDAPAFQSTY
tara:strand:+ start:8795 stop:14779 length:5985 start_codon:yes stop_codon:yes gene_type:complete